MEVTHQRKTWEEEFGEGYLERNVYDPDELNRFYKNRFGLTKDQINDRFLENVPKDAKILEVGTNIGNQLFHLQSQGFTNLYGIEIQDRAINYAKHRTDNLNIIKGDALDIPFKDNYFDLVFTHGVLIHISPQNIKKPCMRYTGSQTSLSGDWNIMPLNIPTLNITDKRTSCGKQTL